ncbi:nuclear transport factor 2 family protein [Streptomyces sp. NPDC000983]|uniref:nuclear transport factor 2 family protein n=1 Tax=Streptomyces sp. NPDC000983 TaxID=3154373 RepID=UPI00331AFA92
MDRSDIIDTCTRMAWYADLRDWDRLAAVFADKVTLDYTSLNGGEPVTLEPGQIAAAWREGFSRYTATQHLLTNHLVTVDGDGAVCTAAFHATHHGSSDLGATLWTLGGTYRFDLVRTAGGWRIAGLVMTAVWGDGNRALAP